MGSKILGLAHDVDRLSIHLGMFAVIFVAYITVPLTCYILLEEAFSELQDLASENPDAALGYVDVVLSRYILYGVMVSVFLIATSLSILMIARRSQGVLGLFGWDLSARIMWLIAFIQAIFCLFSAVLNLMYVFVSVGQLREYLFGLINGSPPPVRESLLYSAVRVMMIVCYMAMGVGMGTVFIIMDIFAGQVGVFRRAKIGFKILSIGAMIYLLEFFFRIPLSIFIMPTGALITFRRLRWVALKVRSYAKTRGKP